MAWFVRVTIALLFALCGLSCAQHDQRIIDLRASVAAQDRDLDEVEVRARSLSAQWDDVKVAFERARERYAQASTAYEAATAHALEAKAAYESASAEWQRAAQAWRYYQALVRVAAAIDASNLDSYRAWRRPTAAREARPEDEIFSCERVSTATFRAQLVELGWDLAGLDVDHIVPRSLGGADHPSNYQLIPSSLNRSLGARWDQGKCAISGMDRCAEAVAVSRKCGRFSGTLPP